MEHEEEKKRRFEVGSDVLREWLQRLWPPTSRRFSSSTLRVIHLLLAVVLLACTARQHDDRTITPARVLRVPRAPAPFEPEGQFRVERWAPAANTGALRDRDGHGAVPVSEARLLWGDDRLFVRFYAADPDLQVRATQHDGPVWKDDSVALAFISGESERVIQVSPTGVTADGICPAEAGDLGDPRCDLGWESGIRVAADVDGTINELGDMDEEWAVEVAVPLKSLVPSQVAQRTRIAFAVRRCEVAFDGRRGCGSWGRFGGVGTLALESAMP